MDSAAKDEATMHGDVSLIRHVLMYGVYKNSDNDY